MSEDQELEMEMQIWEYLDGVCSAEDRERISMLIDNDAAWGAKYRQCLMLHEGIEQRMELEHPSMRFTMNVMDAVKEEHVAPAAKTYLNKWVIRSIAAIMMVMIGGILIDAMGSLEASSAEGGLFSRMKLDRIATPTLSFRTLMFTFLFCNVLAGLLLLDSIIRRRRHTRNI